MSVARVLAPAKLTWSLHVGARLSNGYHELTAEMVTVDLADEIEVSTPGAGLELTFAEDLPAESSALVSAGPDNLVARALGLVERSALVTVHKKIPLGGGLGGGSADAGALLRWAGGVPLRDAAQLGSDVPFCMVGGRAMVRGVGEVVEPLDMVDRVMTLFLAPFGVDTGSVYAALDEVRASGGGHHERNDLTDAALRVEPRLVRLSAAIKEATGSDPLLAGSGSTLFVDQGRDALGLHDASVLDADGIAVRILEVRTTPASFGEPTLLDEDEAL